MGTVTNSLIQINSNNDQQPDFKKMGTVTNSLIQNNIKVINSLIRTNRNCNQQSAPK
jgi:hypothetical protein